MFRLDSDKPVEFCDGLRRRDFLHAGALSMLGLGLNDLFALKALGAVDPKKDMNCIMLFLVGGPSQLDTWDMKPNAPIEIRGPYKPIKTNVPGIEISENFPRMAKHADKFALIRSVYHTAAAVHDTGHQMMQTGRLFQGGVEHPHIGCVLSKLKGPNGDVPPHVLLPRPIGNTGGNMPHGQNAGFLGKTYDPFVLNADPSDPNFKVPDMLPPDYLSALRVDRRKNWREMVDQIGEQVRNLAGRPIVGCNFPPGLYADVVPEGARGVRAGARAGKRAPEIRAEPFRAKLPAGAPADRGRRAVRHGQHVRDGVRRDHLGHSRVEALQPDQLLSRPGGADVRYGV